MADPAASGPSETARVEAFSDGIFAIAITLLVLNIRVPLPDLTGHGSTLLPALLRLWPAYLGYLISFFYYRHHVGKPSQHVRADSANRPPASQVRTG